MKKLIATLLVLSTLLISAQPPTPKQLPVIPPVPEGKLIISGVLSVDQYQLVELTAAGVPIDNCIWDCIYAPNITMPVSYAYGNEKKTKFIFTGPAGDYRVTATTSSSTGDLNNIVVIATIKGTPPTPIPPPVDPNPPNPNPQPPVDPQPPVNPPPIPDPGLRVLIVYESSDLTKMPASQVNILYSADFRTYLNNVCVKLNNVPEYRVWDKDVNLTNASDIWKNAMARPRSAIPWLLISNGVEGVEKPLPLTLEETMNDVKKYTVVQRRR